MNQEEKNYQSYVLPMVMISLVGIILGFFLLRKVTTEAEFQVRVMIATFSSFFLMSAQYLFKNNTLKRVFKITALLILLFLAFNLVIEMKGILVNFGQQN